MIELKINTPSQFAMEIEKIVKEKSIEYRRDISAGLYNDILPKDFEL